jgi:hypothetical protein
MFHYKKNVNQMLFSLHLNVVSEKFDVIIENMIHSDIPLFLAALFKTLYSCQFIPQRQQSNGSVCLYVSSKLYPKPVCELKTITLPKSICSESVSLQYTHYVNSLGKNGSRSARVNAGCSQRRLWPYDDLIL